MMTKVGGARKEGSARSGRSLGFLSSFFPLPRFAGKEEKGEGQVNTFIPRKTFLPPASGRTIAMAFSSPSPPRKKGQ